jgi:hypothetical protein
MTGESTSPSVWRAWRGLARSLERHGGTQRGWLAAGTVAAIGGALARVVLPLALIAALVAPAPGEPPAVALAIAAGATAVVMLAMRVLDRLARLAFGRFADGAIGRVRARAAVAAAASGAPPTSLGELGRASARVERGMVELLTFGAGAPLAAVAAVAAVAVRDLRLGAALALGVAPVALATLREIGRTYRRARRELGGGTTIVAAQARAMGGALALFAVLVIGGVAWGAAQVAAGTLAAADVVALALYGMVLCGPVVELGGQGARAGLVLATAHRLVELATSPAARPRTAATVVAPPLPRIVALEPAPRNANRRALPGLPPERPALAG